jgi:hypothetical protein
MIYVKHKQTGVCASSVLRCEHGVRPPPSHFCSSNVEGQAARLPVAVRGADDDPNVASQARKAIEQTLRLDIWRDMAQLLLYPFPG